MRKNNGIYCAYVAVLLLLMFLAGCSKMGAAKYDADGPLAEGDQLVESSIADAKTLNPPLVSETAGGALIDLIFNGLLKYNEKLEHVPNLAERWTVSPDGKVITYFLRKGVRFHDGVEFTAADVIFTYQTMVDPKTQTPYGSDYMDISECKALDPYTVRVTYKQPFAPALDNFFAILPKHLLEGKDINKSDFNRHPIGTGPYKFVEWKTDQRIVLEANPDYFGGAPHVKRFVLRIIPNQSSELLELLNGGIDAMGAWTSGTLTPEQYKRQTDTPKFSKSYNKYECDDFVYTYIGWNLKRPMFADKRVRQALTMALDRKAMVDNILFGLGTLCTGPFARVSWAYNPDVAPYPFDIEKAKALLKQAGWEDTDKDGLLDKDYNGDKVREPFHFKLITNQGNVSRERVATIVQEQLKAIGIQADIQIVEWTAFLTNYINKRDFDAIVMGWSLSLDPDSYAIWHSSQTGENQYNFVSYSNPEVDRLIIAGRRTLDFEKRKAIYRRIHALIAEDQPYTFLYIPYSLPAVHKRFKGLTVSRVKIGWNPEQWYVPKAQQKRQMTP